jgi:hypothetical protein
MRRATPATSTREEVRRRAAHRRGLLVLREPRGTASRWLIVEPATHTVVAEWRSFDELAQTLKPDPVKDRGGP